jgi:hypothetical protein
MDSQNRDRLDDLLDGALKQYGNVEPRLGLEGRVLANLAAQGSRARARSTWVWAVAGTCAVVVLALWCGHLVALKSHSDVSVRVPHDVMAPRTLMPPVVKEASRHKDSRPRRRVWPRSMTVAAEPKLQQFPSSRPISEQELLVAEYTVRYPQEAMLVVQEQQNFEEQVRQAQRELQESLRNSENQER